MYEADRRLWLTADKERVVEDGDPEAAFLLASKGTEIDDAEAERYGLTKAKAPAPDKAKAAPADKARVPGPGPGAGK